MDFDIYPMYTGDDSLSFKCFYGTEGQDYGEFYLHMNIKRRKATLHMKESTFAVTLTHAFGKAMGLED